MKKEERIDLRKSESEFDPVECGRFLGGHAAKV